MRLAAERRAPKRCAQTTTALWLLASLVVSDTRDDSMPTSKRKTATASRAKKQQCYVTLRGVLQKKRPTGAVQLRDTAALSRGEGSAA